MILLSTSQRKRQETRPLEDVQHGGATSESVEQLPHLVTQENYSGLQHARSLKLKAACADVRLVHFCQSMAKTSSCHRKGGVTRFTASCKLISLNRGDADPRTPCDGLLAQLVIYPANSSSGCLGMSCSGIWYRTSFDRKSAKGMHPSDTNVRKDLEG